MLNAHTIQKVKKKNKIKNIVELSENNWTTKAAYSSTKFRKT